MKVLFLCTGNSCRSQMAEGWARQLKSVEFTAYSAGIIKSGLDPFAVQVMREAGVDISHQKSKVTAELPLKEFDYVITLCEDAAENCPYFPARTKILHRGFDDPPRLTAPLKDKEQVLSIYRRVRDEIKGFILSLPAGLRL